MPSTTPVTPRCTVTRVVNVLQAANLNATTLTLTGLTPGGYYKRGVTAVDAAGNESPHTKIAVVAPPRDGVRMRPACAKAAFPALPVHRDATNLALVRNRAHPVRGKDRSPPWMTR